jgi:hypothetical protein
VKAGRCREGFGRRLLCEVRESGKRGCVAEVEREAG